MQHIERMIQRHLKWWFVYLGAVFLLSSSAAAMPAATARSFFERAREDKVTQLRLYRTADAVPVDFHWSRMEINGQSVRLVLDKNNVLILAFKPIVALQRGGSLGRPTLYIYLP